MELLLGFVIAMLIAVTGVGAGTMTAPLLILFLHVPVAVAVGSALAFSAAVKLLVVPVRIWRGQVVWRIFGIMLITGLPGVVLGTSCSTKLSSSGQISFGSISLSAR